MSIKMKLTGFDELFTKIQKAGGSVNKAAETCMKQSADIMEKELKSQMQKANVKQRLINEMPKSKLSQEGNQFIAEVGFVKGEYDPKNVSDAYKVVFLNYGTPKRPARYGKIKARGFIQKAKKKANPQIKKKQEETLNEILKRLKMQ